MAKIIGKFSDYVIDKVKYVAFTDGVQRDFDLYLNQNIQLWVKNNCIAYNAHPIKRSNYQVEYAGHSDHVYTTGYAWPKIQEDLKYLGV